MDIQAAGRKKSLWTIQKRKRSCYLVKCLKIIKKNHSWTLNVTFLEVLTAHPRLGLLPEEELLEATRVGRLLGRRGFPGAGPNTTRFCSSPCETWRRHRRTCGGDGPVSRGAHSPNKGAGGAGARGGAAGPHRAASGGERRVEISQDLWTGSTACRRSNPTFPLHLCRADSVYMPQPHEGKSSYLIFIENWERLSSIKLYWAKVTGNKNVHFKSFLVWAKISFMVNNCITHVSRAWVLTIVQNSFSLGYEVDFTPLL